MSRGASDYPYFDEPFACMAHRGGYLTAADAARENTLYAFGRAVAAGYRYLETDVHVSSDGRLIAFHDTVLDRVTQTTGVIAELPFTEIRAARIAGKDQIPTLDEVLDAFPGTRINIDIKAPGAVEPLAVTLRAHRAEDRVCVTSFSAARLGRFRRLMGPGVATGRSPVAVAWAAHGPRWAQRVGLPGQALQVPVTHRIAGREVPVLTPRLIAAARAQDVRVHVWTINDPEQMHELIDLGVDGLITDRITELRSVAIERGLWNG